MTRIEIEKKEINASQEKVFEYLGNFNNYKELLPDSVSEWQSTPDQCTFKIQGLTRIEMKMQERVPHSSIFITSQGESPFDFTLTIHIDPHEEHCFARMVFEAEINLFMRMMVEKPLGSFFGYLIKKVQQKFEQG